MSATVTWLTLQRGGREGGGGSATRRAASHTDRDSVPDLRWPIKVKPDSSCCCKLQRPKFPQGKTWDRGGSYQHKALLGKTGAHPLSAPHSSSHRIKFLSPVVYLQCVLRAAQTCHNEDGAVALARRAASAPAPESFAFLISAVTAEPALIETPSYLLCLFCADLGFSWKTGDYACVSVSREALIGGVPDKWRCRLAPHSATANQTGLPSQRVASG